MKWILSLILSGLTEKKVGNQTLYINGEKVSCLVENGIFTYVEVLEKDNQQKEHRLVRYSLDEGIIKRYAVRLSNLFIVPRKEMESAELVTKGDLKDPDGLTENIFLVSNWGVLDEPSFSNCNLSNSLVPVWVKNLYGDVYQVPFKVGEGMVGCSGIHRGTIKGGYSFRPIINIDEMGRMYL